MMPILHKPGEITPGQFGPIKREVAEAFITRFKWNEAKFQAKRPLKELVELITESVGKIEDDLKVCFS